MNNLQASHLFDLAAGLHALTTAIVTHVDDPRPSSLAFGLAVAAENLASQLADVTWQMVEDAVDSQVPESADQDQAPMAGGTE